MPTRVQLHDLSYLYDELPLVDTETYHRRISALFPDWHADAACAGMGNNDFFGDENEHKSMSYRQIRKAEEICRQCPVFDVCLRSALENDEKHGVWAGTSGRVRAKIQAMLKRGEVSLDQVVEDYVDGRKSPYEGVQGRTGVPAQVAGYAAS